MYIAYDIWMGLSIALCAAIFTLMARRQLNRWPLGALTLLIGIPLGAIGAKLLYYVTQLDFVLAEGWLFSLYNPNPAKWSIFGGALGVCLAVILAAKAVKLRPVSALDLFAPVGALLLALARFGCFFLQEDLIGCGDYTDLPALCFFPMSVSNEWGEHYLAVFMLETLCALVIAVISATRLRERRALRTVFYLCLTQIFCESLHGDSISWLFVRVEQLLCMLTLMGVLIVYMVKTPRTGHRLRPLWVGIGCALLFVGVEFALDKSDWPVLLLYGAMLAGLATLAWAEHDGFRRMNSAR